MRFSTHNVTAIVLLTKFFTQRLVISVEKRDPNNSLVGILFCRYIFYDITQEAKQLASITNYICREMFFLNYVKFQIILTIRVFQKIQIYHCHTKLGLVFLMIYICQWNILKYYSPPSANKAETIDKWFKKGSIESYINKVDIFAHVYRQNNKLW